MKRFLLISIILFAYSLTSIAQQFYNTVLAVNDTQFFNDKYVIVSRIAFPKSGGNPCDSAYWIGDGSVNGYIYKFSKAVNMIQLKAFAINAGEQIAIVGNGALYNLTASNLSVYNCGTSNMAATSGGLLVHSSGTFSNATVTINFPTAVDSIRIHHLNGFGGGTTYSFNFLWDTAVVIKQPFNDTLWCAGDTVKVNYGVNTKFKNNNVFTVQLSDDTGSFANPVNIGSLSSDTDGVINCVIPPTIKNGTGYKFRIQSSGPVRVSDDIGKIIKIGNPDSAGISISNNTPICIGDSLVFNTTCTIPDATFQWTGPSGFNSLLKSPSLYGVIGASAGNYYSTIKFYGCVVKDTIPVAVQASPATPTASSNSPICARDTLKLISNNSTGGVSYSWTGSGGFTSTAQNPAIGNTSSSSAGIYTVIASLNGCKRKNTTTVTVIPSPAIVALHHNGPLCSGDSLHLSTDTSSAGVTHNWTGPNGFNDTGQYTHLANTTAASTGWYKATLGLNGCYFKDSAYVNVITRPLTPANPSANTPLCIGETLNLNAGTVPGTSYQWTGPNSFSSNLQNPTRSNMQPTDAGIYSVTANANGCASLAGNIQVVVNPLPFVVILAAPGDTICSGNLVMFTTLPNNAGGTPQYRWYVNGTSTGASGPIFNTTTLNNADVITCRMTENTKCSVPYTDESNDIKITVLPWLPASVSITASPNKILDPGEYVTFTATPVNGGISPAYQWKRHGTDILGATSYQWGANTLNDYDLVTVEMFSSYRCPLPAKASSNGIALHVLTAIGDPDDISRITLHPNPNNGNFVLSGKIETKEELKIEVINTMGQVVYNHTVSPVNNYLKHSLQIDNAASGVYFMKVSAGTQVAVTRFSIN